MIEKVPMPLLEKDYEWPGWNVFRNQMNRDMAKLNKAATGDGKFVPFPLTYGMPEKNIRIPSFLPCLLFINWFAAIQRSWDKNNHRKHSCKEMSFLPKERS